MAGIGESIRANLLTLAAFGGYALQVTAAPLWLSVLLPNALVALALCYFTGVRRMMGRTVPRRLMALSAIAALLAVAAYTYRAARGASPPCRCCRRGSCWPRPRRCAAACRKIVRATPIGSSGRWPPRRPPFALRAVLYMTGVAHTWALLEATTWNVVFLTLGLLTLPCLMLGTIMIIHDRMLAEREQEANTDFLTGLLSRKAWWLQAERYCAQALRTRRPLTLLLLDIDHFKRINDLHGHAVGDAVLRHFGLLAIATLRSSDHAGRVGGEEFAVMFPDSRGEAVMEVAGRLLESVRRTPCGHGGGAISYTFSAGVAEWIPGENLQSLFERADRCTRRRPPGATASAGRASKPSRPSARR